MNRLTREEFRQTVTAAGVKPRLRKILRFVPEEVTEWDCRDFLAVTDKSGREGVLLYGNTVASFTLTPRGSKASGQVAAVICDICATWQRGTASATLTLYKDARRSVSHLVCGDLNCSLHVRGITAAGLYSRSQIRENITAENRVARLRKRLEGILAS